MVRHEDPVEKLMTPQPVSVRPDDALDDVLRTLARYPFRHLPVVEGNELRGIVSDRDVLLSTGWLYESERKVDKDFLTPTKVADIMTERVRSLPSTATVGEAVGLLLDERIGAVPIVDDVGLLGILTETDLLQALHDESPAQAAKETVEDLMQTEVQTAQAEDDLLHAAGHLLDSRIRHLPVVTDGKLEGILSDRDVRLGLASLSHEDAKAESQGASKVPEMKVGDLMTEAPFTITPQSTLSSAIHCMVEERIGALPVVRDRWVVGILSRVDIVRRYLGTPAASNS